MNMMPNQDFAQENEAIDLEKTQGTNPQLARLMKAWESKQASQAKKAGAFGLMAVSLAACGGSSSSDNSGEPEPVQPVGETFPLTIGEDNIVGTAFNDIFNAPLVSGIVSSTGVPFQSLESFDILDGGDGVDTLNAVLGNPFAFPITVPTISNIEIYNITARGDATLDLSASTGYEQLWTINTNFDLSLDNVGESATLGLNNVGGGTTYDVDYTSAADTSVQNVAGIDVGSDASGRATLDVDAPNGIETLNLSVSAGVRLNLDNDADEMEVFTITGSGLTDLVGDDSFPNLVTLDSTGYTGDLTLDVSGSGTLENVLTGPGNDTITAAAANFSVDTPATTVNLGAGDNRLVLDDVFNTTLTGGVFVGGGIIDGTEISALDFTLAPVTNVQTLELVNVQLFDDASLALEGVGGLETLVFDGFSTTAGDDFTITGAPATLLISATDEFENNGLFTIEGAVDLTIESTGTVDPTDSDVRIDNNLNSTTLETLVINAFDDAELDADGGLDALTSIEVNALGDDADVDLDNFAGDEFGALQNVTVTAADDADLNMDGRVPVQQVQTFGIVSNNAAGSIVLNFPGIGNVVIPVPVGSSTAKANAVENFINNPVNGVDGYTVIGTPGGEFIIQRDDAGPAPVSFVSGINVFLDELTLDTAGVLGTGFEALDTVVVEGGDQADVDLVNVYGNFTLEVSGAGTAGNGLVDEVDVTLTNTGVTQAVVTGGNEFTYSFDILGNVTGVVNVDFTDIDINEANGGTGNQDLTLLDVNGAAANVTMSGNLSSFSTLDLTGVTNWFNVDASGAEYTEGTNVFYLIGGTSSDWGGSTASGGDSTIELGGAGVENVREVVTFTDADFGTVVIANFAASSADPSETDRIDLSDLGFTNEGQLDFEVGSYGANGVFTSGAGNDIRITDGNLTDGASMSGEIIVVDIDTTPAGVEALQSNIVYL